MEEQTQYAKTSDGVRIGYVRAGGGPPLLMASQIWGSLHMAQAGISSAGYWSMEELHTLARSVVLYDARGTGASDRRVADYSLPARVRDLQAVARSSGCERFPLFGFGHGAATAIAFAVDQPEAVEQLILCNPFVSGSDYYRTTPALRALKATEGMAKEEWDYYTHSLATGVLGFDQVEQSHRLALAFQSAMLPEDIFAFRAAAEATDIGSLLARVGATTLVVRDSSVRVGLELGRDVAASIPGAQFVTTTDSKATVRELLGASTEMHAAASAPLSLMTAILLVDIADSTALTEQLGDAAFRTRARDLDEALRSIVRDNGGSVIDAKTLGDGILATFPAAAQAIVAALTCVATGDTRRLPLHVGIHAGDVIREANNVFGGAVNIASRISGLSRPGEVLVSDVVRALARTSASVRFEDRGEQTLRGIVDPVRIYAVRPNS